MTFNANKVLDFIELFDAAKHKIRNVNGCTHLELLNDIDSPNIYFTYSYWQSEIDLENYRNSELFKTVWGKTKVLFSAKAEAWSVEQKIILP